MKAVNLEKLLPADVPAGERVLWFGKPEAMSLWRRAYRADGAAAWFGVMTLWNFVSATADGGAFAGFVSAARTLGVGCAALALLALLAWLSARTTLYVITERRVVIKSGIALPVFFNLPFKQIGAAAMRACHDETGDVALALVDKQRIPYLALWPSARPLRFSRPEPALRSVPHVRDVASMLGRALAEASGQTPTAVRAPPVEAGEPARAATVPA